MPIQSTERRRSPFHAILLAVFGLSVFGLTGLSRVQAATYVVNQTNDVANAVSCAANTSCNFRQALTAAQANAGADVINFDSTIFSSAQTITVNSDLPTVTQSVTINGPSSGVTFTTTTDQHTFLIVNSGTVSLSNATIFDYLYEGIQLNGAALSVQNCGFRSMGAGIRATSGTVNATNSTFTDNGDGILILNGTSTVNGCLFQGNTDAGFWSYAGSSTVQNSTFISGHFGVVPAAGSIQNCTIVRNDTGISLLDTPVSITNNIVVGNTVDRNGAAPSANTNNIYGALSNAGLVTSAGEPVLANNGGPTKTVTLAVGSPALDAAGDTGLATDQRGVARPQGTADDIGAVEVEKVPPVVTVTRPTANQTVTSGTAVAGFVIGTATDNAGVSSVLVKLYRTRSGVKEFWNGTTFVTTSIGVNADLGTPGGTSTAWTLNNWPSTAQLGLGAYSVTVSALDFEANSSTAVTRNFTIVGETTAPSVAIAHPAANATVSAQSLLLTGIDGTATDNDAVGSISVKFYLDGTTRQYWNGTAFTSSNVAAPIATTGLNTASATWSISPMPSKTLLVPGTYRIEASALDLSGNSGGATRTFTIINDTTAPGVTITKPTANQKIKPSDFSIFNNTGTATDNIGVVSVTLKLYRTITATKEYWNGTAWVTTSASTTASLIGSDPKNVIWRLDSAPPAASLTPGNYGLQAQAKDAAGNSSLATTGFVIVNDTEPPVAFVTEPAANGHVLQSDFNANTIFGRATDNERVVSVTIKLYRTVGGVKQYWNGAAFGTASVSTEGDLFGSDFTNLAWKMHTPPSSADMTPGAYSVQVGAKDFAGNSSTFVTRNFTIDPPAAPKPSGESF